MGAGSDATRGGARSRGRARGPDGGEARLGAGGDGAGPARAAPGEGAAVRVGGGRRDRVPEHVAEQAAGARDAVRDIAERGERATGS